jgi:hypothetical protein
VRESQAGGLSSLSQLVVVAKTHALEQWRRPFVCKGPSTVLVAKGILWHTQILKHLFRAVCHVVGPLVCWGECGEAHRSCLAKGWPWPHWPTESSRSAVTEDWSLYSVWLKSTCTAGWILSSPRGPAHLPAMTQSQRSHQP